MALPGVPTAQIWLGAAAGSLEQVRSHRRKVWSLIKRISYTQAQTQHTPMEFERDQQAKKTPL